MVVQRMETLSPVILVGDNDVQTCSPAITSNNIQYATLTLQAAEFDACLNPSMALLARSMHAITTSHIVMALEQCDKYITTRHPIRDTFQRPNL